MSEYQMHLFTYGHEGDRWSLELRARNEADARARLARLPYAQYDGVLVATIPVGGGIATRFLGALASQVFVWLNKLTNQPRISSI